MAGREVIDNASKLVTVESGNFCKMFLEIFQAHHKDVLINHESLWVTL